MRALFRQNGVKTVGFGPVSRTCRVNPPVYAGEFTQKTGGILLYSTDEYPQSRENSPVSSGFPPLYALQERPPTHSDTEPPRGRVRHARRRCVSGGLPNPRHLCPGPGAGAGRYPQNPSWTSAPRNGFSAWQEQTSGSFSSSRRPRPCCAKRAFRLSSPPARAEIRAPGVRPRRNVPWTPPSNWRWNKTKPAGPGVGPYAATSARILQPALARRSGPNGAGCFAYLKYCRISAGTLKAT